MSTHIDTDTHPQADFNRDYLPVLIQNPPWPVATPGAGAFHAFARWFAQNHLPLPENAAPTAMMLELRERYRLAPPLKPRTTKPPSLAKKLLEAKKAGQKAGLPVTGATIAADGSISLSFGETAKSNGSNDLDQWLAEQRSRSMAGRGP
jgi:hypothetical protein